MDKENKKRQKLSYSAINNTNLLVYYSRMPVVIPIDKFLNVFEHKKINESVNQKSNTVISEYQILDEVYIHSLTKNNQIKLNKISRFYEFSNIPNMFEISPYSLKPFNLTSLNSIIDETCDQSSIFYENDGERSIKRNFKILGGQVNIEGIELDQYLGYLVGIFLGRGYIEKKDRNLKGNAVLLGAKNNAESISHILSDKLHANTFHKQQDGVDYFTILDENLNNFFYTYFAERQIPDWFYSAPHIFLNGFMHGFFETNGTISFNKEDSKAFITFKIVNEQFALQFIDFITNKYRFLSTFSLIPNKRFCKVTVKMTKELHSLMNTGFSYKSITNENKLELLNKADGIFFDNPVNIPYRYNKVKLKHGFNLLIPNSKGFAIGNGVFVSAMNSPLIIPKAQKSESIAIQESETASVE